MPDLWTERYKFQHRLQGIVNSVGNDIAKILEGALETVTGKIIILESKADETESLVRKKKYLSTQKSEIEKVLNGVYDDIGKEIKGSLTIIITRSQT